MIKFILTIKNKILVIVAIVVFAMTCGVALNVNISTKNNNVSDMVLANVEALTDPESFYFNGQFWTNEHQWYNLGSNWNPIQHTCTGTSGSTGVQVCLGYNGSGVCIQWGFQNNSWTGNMVSCLGGSGNCWNGTNCIPG